MLDLYVRQGKPTSYQNDTFHEGANAMPEAVYEGINDAPIIESKDGCSNLGKKHVTHYKVAKPATIKQKIATWARQECIPIGAARVLLAREVTVFYSLTDTEKQSVGVCRRQVAGSH